MAEWKYFGLIRKLIFVIIIAIVVWVVINSIGIRGALPGQDIFSAVWTFLDWMFTIPGTS